MKSKVYFTNMHAALDDSLLSKLERLLRAAGFEEIDFDKQYTAIKLHFGEPGNLSYVRPNYARVLADYVKRLGGKPFLTDCNTLYPGGRKDALDHIDSAYLNGFSPLTTGVHIIIGDGLKGTDEVEVEVPGGVHVQRAKIGRAVMDADVLISLNHFKGHEEAGFGGALKNLGMGCGSRAGKMEMHNAGKPSVEQDTCIGCGKCLRQCAHEAITVSAKRASDARRAAIGHDRCVGCGRCIGACPTDAITCNWDESTSNLCEKIAEYSAAVVHGRPCFHINLVMDVSPNCDCHAENDIPIVPNVGMFAGYDPVALDVACAAAVNAQPPVAGSMLEKSDGYGSLPGGDDHFTAVSPHTNWRWTIAHAVRLGIGSDDYELIEVE